MLKACTPAYFLGEQSCLYYCLLLPWKNCIIPNRKLSLMSQRAVFFFTINSQSVVEVSLYIFYPLRVPKTLRYRPATVFPVPKLLPRLSVPPTRLLNNKSFLNTTYLKPENYPTFCHQILFSYKYVMLRFNGSSTTINVANGIAIAGCDFIYNSVWLNDLLEFGLFGIIDTL